MEKQACTGKTEDDLYFPISVIVTRDELGSGVDYSSCSDPSCSVLVWVYSSLSGLIILNDKGIIKVGKDVIYLVFHKYDPLGTCNSRSLQPSTGSDTLYSRF